MLRNSHFSQNNNNSKNNSFNGQLYAGSDFSLETALSLQYFESHNAEEFFRSLKSSSSVRKIYDSYINLYEKYKSNPPSLSLQIDIWMAKIAYQESRKVIPSGFMLFLQTIYTKLNKNASDFKDFLEVFVAYHKFFNPSAS